MRGYKTSVTPFINNVSKFSVQSHPKKFSANVADGVNKFNLRCYIKSMMPLILDERRSLPLFPDSILGFSEFSTPRPVGNGIAVNDWAVYDKTLQDLSALPN